MLIGSHLYIQDGKAEAEVVKLAPIIHDRLLPGKIMYPYPATAKPSSNRTMDLSRSKILKGYAFNFIGFQKR